MGKTFMDSLEKYCRTPYGFASLEDVQTKKQADDMESFFFAETMKYLYLLFAPPDALEFDSIVFNTEAHPMRRSVGLRGQTAVGEKPTPNSSAK
jgi:hypothetical protein